MSAERDDLPCAVNRPLAAHARLGRSEAMYRIFFHEDEGYLETEISGFWTLDEVFAFDREIRHYIERYGRRFPHFALLSDSRNFAVQSAEVGAAFAACSTAANDRPTGCRPRPSGRR